MDSSSQDTIRRRRTLCLVSTFLWDYPLLALVIDLFAIAMNQAGYIKEDAGAAVAGASALLLLPVLIFAVILTVKRRRCHPDVLPPRTAGCVRCGRVLSYVVIPVWAASPEAGLLLLVLGRPPFGLLPLLFLLLGSVLWAGIYYLSVRRLLYAKPPRTARTWVEFLLIGGWWICLCVFVKLALQLALVIVTGAVSAHLIVLTAVFALLSGAFMFFLRRKKIQGGY